MALRRNRAGGTKIRTVKFSLQGAYHCKVSCTGVSGSEVATVDIEVRATIEALRHAISERADLEEFCLILPKATILSDTTKQISDILNITAEPWINTMD